MNQEIKFLEKLRELKEEAAASRKMLSDEEIRVYFDNEKLTEQQLQMIRDYIKEDTEDEIDLSEEDLAYLEEYETIFAMAKEVDTGDYALYERAKNGDKWAFDTLAAGYMPKVLDIAKAHKKEGVFLEDLVSEGSIGLTEGLYSFSSPETAHEEIMDAIRKSIRLYLMELEAERTHDNSIIDKVRKMDEALDILKEDLGRKVYIEEVAEYMQITEEEVWDILKLTGEDVSGEDDKEEELE